MFITNNIFKQFQSFTINMMAIELLEHAYKRTYTIIIIISVKPFGKLKINVLSQELSNKLYFKNNLLRIQINFLVNTTSLEKI